LRLAFQPVLLASLASSALPVSNLTNLIVADHIDVGTLDFLWRLGPASLIATIVGWFRLPTPAGRGSPARRQDLAADRRARGAARAASSVCRRLSCCSSGSSPVTRSASRRGSPRPWSHWRS
jgi:Na+/H+ antiporter NhaD/arsenite permease-like protein